MSSGLNDLCGEGGPHRVLPCLHVSSSRHTCSCLLHWSCGSLPRTDHCFSHHICNLLAQLNFVDHSLGRLFYQFNAHPFPPLIGSGWCLVSGQVSISTEVLSVWWYWLVAVAGLVPTHRVAMLCLVFLLGPDQPLTTAVPKFIDWGEFNRPFPNYLWPLFQSGSWCSSFHMKISSHSHANEN